MNDTLIELYRGVQKHRGEWRPGDRYFDILHREYGVLCDFCDTNSEGGLIISVNWLWLPPPTPRWPGDEGRNLWAMVDWGRWWSHIDRRGTISILRRGRSEIVIADQLPLPEALLRAIREQEANHER